MKLFSGTSNIPLSEKIAAKLHVPLLPVDMHIFPDGERRVRIEEPVAGEACVVIQSTSTPVDGNYMELVFIIDGLKRSGATSVTVVIPYVGYQRQDHVFREGEAVSLAVVIKMLEAMGADNVIACDLHSIKIPEFFHIPLVHVSALPLFAKKISEIEGGGSADDAILISPDMGGIRRVKLLSEMLDNMPYASIEKNRDLESGNVTADVIHGDIKKRAFIIDDMISSGSTITTAADLLTKKGVEEIYVFATHPVFSGNAAEVLQNSIVKKVFVTDTIAIPEKKRFAKLEILSIVAHIVSELKSV